MKSPYRIIQAKRDGHPVTASEIDFLVTRYAAGDLPDYQMAAFLMAVFFRGMTGEETSALTRAMIHSGDSIDPEELGSPTADKHSTGGVGDKISIVLAPLAAAAGLRVPMMSGRGLGHTGGTLDKLESIPGFTTRLDKNRFIRQIDRIGVAMIGQTDRMVPADKKMYALRDVTATVDCIPLIAASIMSKKIASGPRNLVLDIKVGRGAFMTEIDPALNLARTMVEIGSTHGRNVRAILTDMGTAPIGQAVGNSLELIESAEVLQGRGSRTVRELALILAASMMTMTRTAPDERQAVALLEKLLDSGAAYEKFLEMVEAQDGDPDSVTQPYESLHTAPEYPLISDRSGILHGIDPLTIGFAAVELGAGRKRQEDDIDSGVGFVIHAGVGDAINSGDLLASVYARNRPDTEWLRWIQNAFEISDSPAVVSALVLDRVNQPGD